MSDPNPLLKYSDRFTKDSGTKNVWGHSFSGVKYRYNDTFSIIAYFWGKVPKNSSQQRGDLTVGYTIEIAYAASYQAMTAQDEFFELRFFDQRFAIF